MLAILLPLFLLAATAASGQPSYTIDWWKIAGGGGLSTGGTYTAGGSIGQSDVAAASGGNFTVVSGFWGMVATVQTSNAPLLSMTRTITNTIMLSWPSASPGWGPRHTFDLGTANWVTPPEAVGDDGTNRFIIIGPPAGNRFFRLSKQ